MRGIGACRRHLMSGRSQLLSAPHCPCEPAFHDGQHLRGKPLHVQEAQPAEHGLDGLMEQRPLIKGARQLQARPLSWPSHAVTGPPQLEGVHIKDQTQGMGVI